MEVEEYKKKREYCVYRENETRQSSNKAKGECERRKNLFLFLLHSILYKEWIYVEYFLEFWSEAKQRNGENEEESPGRLVIQQQHCFGRKKTTIAIFYIIAHFSLLWSFSSEFLTLFTWMEEKKATHVDLYFSRVIHLTIFHDFSML